MDGIIWLMAAGLVQSPVGGGAVDAVPALPATYEMVMDIDVDAKGLSTACRVVKNSDASIDPCESMPPGESLTIPVGSPGSMAGTVRVTTTAAFRRR